MMPATCVPCPKRSTRAPLGFIVGIPGASNAFAIAERLGLPEGVVGVARELVGEERTQLSDVIERLTESQRSTERDSRRAAGAAQDVERRRDEYDRRLRQLEIDRARTLEKARQQAEEMVRSARREADRFRNELRRLEKEAARIPEQPNAAESLKSRLTRAGERVENRAEDIEQRVTKAVRKVSHPPAEPDAPMQTDDRPPAVGDGVWIPSLAQRGTLLSEPSGGKAQVQVGALHTAVAYDSLRRIVQNAQPAAWSPASNAPGGGLRMQARTSISPEVKLIGMRAEDALTELEGYVDQACLAGLSPFRIVHGKGTGALKRVVWEYLQAHPHVGSWRHPDESDGGTGVTVAELRDGA